MTEPNLPFELAAIKCICGSSANLILLGASYNSEGRRFFVIRCNICGQVLFLDAPVSNGDIKSSIKEAHYCG